MGRPNPLLRLRIRNLQHTVQQARQPLRYVDVASYTSAVQSLEASHLFLPWNQFFMSRPGSEMSCNQQWLYQTFCKVLHEALLRHRSPHSKQASVPFKVPRSTPLQYFFLELTEQLSKDGLQLLPHPT